MCAARLSQRGRYHSQRVAWRVASSVLAFTLPSPLLRLLLCLFCFCFYVLLYALYFMFWYYIFHAGEVAAGVASLISRIYRLVVAMAAGEGEKAMQMRAQEKREAHQVTGKEPKLAFVTAIANPPMADAPRQQPLASTITAPCCRRRARVGFHPCPSALGIPARAM
jgi:hypothetical protein